MSSGTHDPDTIEGWFNKPVFLGGRQLAHPTDDQNISGPQRYATSKLCNVLFAYELARRLEDSDSSDVRVIAYDPGAVPATSLLRNVKNPLVRYAVRASSGSFKLMGVITSTSEKSGTAIARLLLDSNLTGQYYQINRERKSSKLSYDEAAARQL